MRDLSVTEIKRRTKGLKLFAKRQKPEEGSSRREIYDRLMANAGKTVCLFEEKDEHEKRMILSSLGHLEVEYGLDIRLVQHGWKDKRPTLHVLAGEWFGKIYVDYIADTEEQMDLIANARIVLTMSEHPENMLPAGVHHLSAKSIDILKRVAAKGREIEEKHTKRSS